MYLHFVQGGGSLRLLPKKLFFQLALFSCYMASPVWAQDIYDATHTRRFAEYLLKAGQYEQSAAEYERLLFLAPTSDTLRLNLLTAYRRAGKYALAIERTRSFYPDLSLIPGPIAVEYGRLFLDQQQYDKAEDFWQQTPGLPAPDRRILGATVASLRGDFRQAYTRVQELSANEHALAEPYQVLFEEASQLRLKSPALAGILSGVVPGSGRFYTRDWKDALFSMVFIGTSAWQSYRGFLRTGVESVRGWIFGGIATGFYIGNIYGSARSAKLFNQKKKAYYQRTTEQLFQSHY